jgi:hypothetical protein
MTASMRPEPFGASNFGFVSGTTPGNGHPPLVELSDFEFRIFLPVGRMGDL